MNYPSDVDEIREWSRELISQLGAFRIAGQFLQTHCLRRLWAAGRDGLSVSDLAQLVNASPQGTTRVLNTFRDQGWIDEMPQQEDRRIRRYALNSRGLKEVKSRDRKHHNDYKMVVDRLSQHERQTVIEGLRLFVQALRERNAS